MQNDLLTNINGGTISMIRNGWKFDFTHDGSILSDNYKQVGKKCAKGAKWYGWSDHSHVGTLVAVLKGSGEVTLSFGNCWDSGKVNVYLDTALMATAPPKSNNVVKTFSFTPGSVLRIKDEDGNAVVRLNYIQFSCYGMKHRYLNYFLNFLICYIYSTHGIGSRLVHFLSFRCLLLSSKQGLDWKHYSKLL